MADQIPNQANFQDNQNFQIDIEKIYQDYIQTIDKARSVVNIADPNNQKLLNKFTVDSFTGTATTSFLKPEKTPQESRCHAFYRLIGFPVVSSDFLIYNPGHDILFNNRTITIDKKVAIANKPLNGFQKLSIDRENYVNDKLKIFSNTTSIDAGVLALSSINIREFDVPIKKSSDAIENSFKSDNQSYDISPVTLVGSNSDAVFFEFQDNNGNVSTKYTSKRSHIIKPFIVDARIDLSTPSLQKVAIPFLYNDSSLKISEIASVQRPLIEKIILDRFSVENQTLNAGGVAQDTIDYIKSISAIKDEEIIKKISSGNVFGFTEQNQFVKHLNIIRVMMSKLYESQNKIKEVQSKYYWLPIPNENGPEFGSGIHAVFAKLPEYLKTLEDQAIIDAQVRSIMDQIDSQAASLKGVPDVGGYAFGKFTNTFEPNTSGAMGNSNSDQLKKLIEQRTHDLTDANNALKTIEIIMGEFSGFGLCDIVAIIGALYIMDKTKLLGFLDDDAFARAKSIMKIDNSNPGINEALTELTSIVKDFYNLMNKIYKDISRSNNQ